MLRGKRRVEKKQELELRRLRMRYQRVFATEDGREVLGDMLRMFGYWDHDSDFPNLRQAAILLLERGGWLHESRVRAIVDGYIEHGPVSDTEPIENDEEEEITWRT